MINRNELIYKERLKPGPIPQYWQRIELETAQNHYNSLKILISWIHENLSGIWSYYWYWKIVNGIKEKFIVIAFEDPNDKFLFQMMGGMDLDI